MIFSVLKDKKIIFFFKLECLKVQTFVGTTLSPILKAGRQSGKYLLGLTVQLEINHQWMQPTFCGLFINHIKMFKNFFFSNILSSRDDFTRLNREHILL